MTVFPSYGLHARLILSQLGTGSIVCINVLNEAAVPLRFPSLPFSSSFFDQGEPEVFPVVEFAKGYLLSVEHGYYLIYL